MTLPDGQKSASRNAERRTSTGLQEGLHEHDGLSGKQGEVLEAYEMRLQKLEKSA